MRRGKINDTIFSRLATQLLFTKNKHKKIVSGEIILELKNSMSETNSITKWSVFWISWHKNIMAVPNH